jgi:hypothetical protein
MCIIHDDLIGRSVNIHWPDGYDAGHADVFAHNAIVIDAPAGTIWPNSPTPPGPPGTPTPATSSSPTRPARSARVSPSTGPRSASRSPARSPSASPHTRIGWYGTGAQLRAYHTWLLIPRNGNSTYVVTEETGPGPAARHLAQANPGHMHRGHELWNISLKFACES